MKSSFEHINKKYKKEISQNFSFFSFVQNKGFLLTDFKIGTSLCTGFRMEKFISACDIAYFKRKNHEMMLLIIGDKKGNLIRIFVRDNEFNYSYHEGLHTALVSVVNINKLGENGNSVLYATGSYDRFIKIFKIKNIDDDGKKNITHLISFKHKFRILEIDWDPFNEDRLLNICQKHATVQVWSISGKSEKEEENKNKKSSDGHFVANIRGHKGFITSAKFSNFEPNTIITASDDQSVKIWNLASIKFKKPPNKKKIAKTEEDLDNVDSKNKNKKEIERW